MKTKLVVLTLALVACAASVTVASPLGTAFTYQGKLDWNGQPANGDFLIRFALYDAPAPGGNLVNGTNLLMVAVTNGLFTSDLDFGANAFAGEARWLDIAVSTNNAVSFITLLPRTRVAPTPNAIYASTAGAVPPGSIQASQLGTTGPAPSPGQVLSFNGTSLAWSNPAAASGAWVTGGNGVAAGNFLGTINNLPLEMRVNNLTALRLTLGNNPANITGAPNILGGAGVNLIAPDVLGATIAGGGVTSHYGTPYANRILSNSLYSTIGGGLGNTISTNAGESTIAGGNQNTVGMDAYRSVIGGGYRNAIATNANSSTIAGGVNNLASGTSATVGGGDGNQALAGYATIGGGFANQIIGAGSGTVGGGVGNTASGDAATVPGGNANVAQGRDSFAAGQAAHALHDGSFVWADRQGTIFSPTPFESTAANQFNVRAAGGARFDTRFLEVIGGANEQAYLGGDGVGNDVQVGSLNPAVTDIYLYNAGSGTHMHAHVGVLTIHGGADLAEPFPMREAEIEKGSVVVIDDEHPGRLKLSTRAYDTQVAGIVSGANGIRPGISLKQEGALDQGQNVALTGRVYVKADASHGAITPGDLLTTGDLPGHAMKVLDHVRAQGAILGKAMSPLRDGKGLVLVLVTLQ